MSAAGSRCTHAGGSIELCATAAAGAWATARWPQLQPDALRVFGAMWRASPCAARVQLCVPVRAPLRSKRPERAEPCTRIDASLFSQARGKKRQIGWFPANYVKLLSPGTSKVTPTELPKPPAGERFPSPRPTAPVSPASHAPERRLRRGGLLSRTRCGLWAPEGRGVLSPRLDRSCALLGSGGGLAPQEDQGPAGGRDQTRCCGGIGAPSPGVGEQTVPALRPPGCDRWNAREGQPWPAVRLAGAVTAPAPAGPPGCGSA